MEARLLTAPGGAIAAVEPDSPAHMAGLRPGDCLLTINGRPVRDVVDYRFYADGIVALEVERAGRRFQVDLEAEGAGLGLEFATPTFDGVRRCANHCPFCFLKGLPRGLRRSLYVRDDDYRYSFLFGNFVTLTNLTEDDWVRLAEQRLSPLYVSVHAADPDLRRRLLGNPRAPDVLAQIRRLAELKIRVHTQVVLCPGLNDGAHLDHTISALAALYPTVQSIGVVPVGLTRHHPVSSSAVATCSSLSPAHQATAKRGRGETAKAGLRPFAASPFPPEQLQGGQPQGAAPTAASLHRFTPAEARQVVSQVGRWQRDLRSRFGRSLVYLADELYLLAGRPFPAEQRYDGFPQYENGIGMVRVLLKSWKSAKRRAGKGLRYARSGRVALVCGTLVAPVLAGLVDELNRLAGAAVELIPVANRFFGEAVSVSGLLTGSDVLAALQDRPPPEVLVLPRSMLDAAGERFLDDLTPGGLAEALGTRVVAAEFLSELLG